MKFRKVGRRISAVCAAVLFSGTATAFSIPWSTVDSGGKTFSSGGGWILAGTIGQHDASQAHALSGGVWTVTGGFWAQSFDLPVGRVLFQDGFEG
jgi:hypothetical protein